MAGRVPRNFIDDLLNRVDIVEVIDSSRTLKKEGQRVLGLLPLPRRKIPFLLGQPRKTILSLLWLPEVW